MKVQRQHSSSQIEPTRARRKNALAKYNAFETGYVSFSFKNTLQNALSLPNTAAISHKPDEIFLYLKDPRSHLVRNKICSKIVRTKSLNFCHK